MKSILKTTGPLFTGLISLLLLTGCDQAEQVKEAPKEAPGEPGPPPAPAPTPSPGGSVVIRIVGSDTLGAKMVPQLAEAYKAAGNNVSFEIAAEGSSSAFTALMSGNADIGMSSRKIKDKEEDGMIAKGLPPKEWTAAYDMIGVIVNENSGITGLSLEQVEGIFTGDVANWSEVGGSDAPISAYTRNTSSGTCNSFQDMAMGKRDYGPDTQKMAGNEQIAQEVARNPNGIGYVGLASAANKGVRAVPLNGVELKPPNARTYPIARSLQYYTVEGKLSDPAKDFLNWATTDKAAKDIVDRVGFIAP